MATKQRQKMTTKRKSKRERGIKVVVYLMILAMVLSSLTAGLAYLL